MLLIISAFSALSEEIITGLNNTQPKSLDVVVQKAPVIQALELWLNEKDTEAENIFTANFNDYLTLDMYIKTRICMELIDWQTLSKSVKARNKIKPQNDALPLKDLILGTLTDYSHNGNQRAQLLLALIGKLSEKVKRLIPLAEKGNKVAAFWLAESYRCGDGIKENPKEAYRWYKKSADAGFSQGIVWAGYCHEHGIGVKRNPKIAHTYYLKAAQLNDGQGAYFAGRCYFYGIGVNKNLIEAAKWYLKAAELEVENAQYELAMMYHLGKGVPHDASQAKEWATRAIENNHPKAQALLDGIIESEKYITCTASKMLNDLHNNALVAHDNYLDKYVKITGILTVIDSSGKYISIADNKYTIIGIQCSIMNQQQREQVKKLRMYQKVTVLGKVTHVGEVIGYHVELDGIK